MTTDTTPMAPTDAEIDAVLCNHWPAFSMQATLVRMWLRDAMRASLDKWGQPAHSEEPAAWKHDCAALLTNDVELWIDACPHCGKPRNAPQPVEREPLTDEQIKGLIEEGVFFGNCKEIVRAIEAAHGIGIKGGLHGTE